MLCNCAEGLHFSAFHYDYALCVYICTHVLCSLTPYVFIKISRFSVTGLTAATFTPFTSTG